MTGKSPAGLIYIRPRIGKAMTSETKLETYRTAVTGLFPELSDSEFTLATAGWDCVAVDVDDRLIFKFPRHEAAEKSLATEVSLLAIVRPAVTMPVPDMSIHAGPPMFSRHAKLRGEHLLTRQYERLPVESRQRLAADMARFFAELHRLDVRTMTAAGAGPLKPWLEPNDILRRVWPVLSSKLRLYAERTVATWQQLRPDPYGTTYGFFDGHGWNMEFDHTVNRLNGIYDFGDSGFGPLHQEFIYPNWVAPDLTARIVGEYEALSGRALDRQRIDLLSGVLRLSELAEFAHDPDHGPTMLRKVLTWSARSGQDYP
jgi:aminoglycoside phosphotransferase (APT) family kinase protein